MQKLNSILLIVCTLLLIYIGFIGPNTNNDKIFEYTITCQKNYSNSSNDAYDPETIIYSNATKSCLGFYRDFTDIETKLTIKDLSKNKLLVQYISQLHDSCMENGVKTFYNLLTDRYKNNSLIGGCIFDLKIDTLSLFEKYASELGFEQFQ